MKENNSWGKKFLSLSSTLALVAGGSVAISTPAQAATHALYINYEADDTLATKGGGFNLGTGGAISIADAPAPHTGKARKIIKAADADPWGGSTILADAETAYSYVDSNNTTITLDYYNGASAAAPVSLEVTAPGVCKAGRTAEAPVGWSTITFDFSQNSGWGYCMGANAAFTVLAIEPNFNATYQNGNDGAYTGAAAVTNAGESYYIDNISIAGGTPADVVSTPPTPRSATSKLITWETNDTSGAIAAGGFEGAEGSAIVTTPTGGNAGKAMKIVKSGNPWSGINVINGGSTTRFTDATNKTITMAFFSPESASVPVMLKLEDSSTSARKYVMARPGWSILSFDMSTGTGWDSTKEYFKVSLFPGFADGDLGAGTNVTPAGQLYYVDNIAFNGATTPALPVAVTRATITRAAAVAGTAKKTKVLTGTVATFGGSTSTKTNQWYRCTATAAAATTSVPSNCTAISGKTGTSYTLTTSDVGKYIRFGSKAHNSAGDTISLSKATAKVVN